MDEHELAWAAGFFDGDGWAAPVRYGRRSNRRPMAQINQAGAQGVPEVLIRFRDAVGVGRIGGPKVEEGREDLYWWAASSRGDVLQTGQRIGPWLSSGKRGQFRSAIAITFDRLPLTSLAWAAGLFDAEGSVSLSDHRSHADYEVIEATITQGGNGSMAEGLTRFRSAAGFGHLNGPYEQAGANELIYRWRVHTVDEVRLLLHLLDPWLSSVKRFQARSAIRTIDLQPTLSRGRPDWGSHKSHCVHGHEYSTARIRPYVSRGKGVQRRESKQCLACTREQARARREAHMKIGGHPAADLDVHDEETTC